MIREPSPAADADTRAWAAWHQFERGHPSRAGLMQVHAANKYLILAHSPPHYRQLGRIAAAPPSTPLALQVDRYRQAFTAALATPASIGGHTNALQHMAGYLRSVVADRDRKQVSIAIHEYYEGRRALTRPLELIARHAHAHNIEYLLRQTYLPPTES